MEASPPHSLTLKPFLLGHQVLVMVIIVVMYVSGGDTAVDTDSDGIGASGFGDGGRNIGGGEIVDSDSDRVGASAPGEFWSW